jgi:hypothetical protein
MVSSSLVLLFSVKGRVDVLIDMISSFSDPSFHDDEDSVLEEE